jgi:hypothetical protein
MPKQKKLFETRLRKSKILDEKDEVKTDLQWSKMPGFWKSQVPETKIEHSCERCGDTIPAGSQADLTVEFDGIKPKKEDLKNIKYWHPDKQCHEKNWQDEPL